MYFARLRVGGKLIRRSLKTDVLSVAKLRLNDFEAETRATIDRKKETSLGRMTLANAADVFKTQTETNLRLKPTSKKYRAELVKSLFKTWPQISDTDVRKITDSQCKEWAVRFGREYSPTRYNATVGVLRALFKVAIEAGAIYHNPASGLHRARLRQKVLELPSVEQFQAFVKKIENGGGRFSQDCAYLVRFLAFGGFRVSEATRITWADCDFVRGEIIVKGDPETATKNSEIRRVSMVPDMRNLLEHIKSERPDDKPETPLMHVWECQKAINRASKLLGIKRITHHDLRHLFATRCIESGVDIPTVSRWLGHKDGGALAMKTYGHLRNEHSQAMAQKVKF